MSPVDTPLGFPVHSRPSPPPPTAPTHRQHSPHCSPPLSPLRTYLLTERDQPAHRDRDKVDCSVADPIVESPQRAGELSTLVEAAHFAQPGGESLFKLSQ